MYVLQSPPQYLYHYTNESGKKGILKDGFIRISQSKERDAVLGDGVYMTELGPEYGKERILLNNYGKNAIPKDKADYYFKLFTDQLKGVQCKLVDGRIVWRFPQNIRIIGVDSVWFVFGETKEFTNSKMKVEHFDIDFPDADNRSPMVSPSDMMLVPYTQNGSGDDSDDSDESFEIIYPSNYTAIGHRRQIQYQQEDSTPGLGTALAVGAAATVVGVGLAAIFGAFHRPYSRRQKYSILNYSIHRAFIAKRFSLI